MNTESKKTENGTSGMGSGIGAFVGTIAGMFAGTAVQGAEATEVEPASPEHPNYPHVVIHQVEEPVKPEPKPEEPKPDRPDPEPVPEPEVNVEVLSVQNIQMEDGTVGSVALVRIGEDYGEIYDLDGDGIADVVGVDIDGDGILSENEVANIQDSLISMYDLAEAANDPMYLAGLNGSDYVNDAQVDDYQLG